RTAELRRNLLDVADETVEDQVAQQGQVGQKATPLRHGEAPLMLRGRVYHALGLHDGAGDGLLAADVDAHVEQADGDGGVVARGNCDEGRIDPPGQDLQVV